MLEEDSPVLIPKILKALGIGRRNHKTDDEGIQTQSNDFPEVEPNDEIIVDLVPNIYPAGMVLA